MPISNTPIVERIARVIAGRILSINAEGGDPSAGDRVDSTRPGVDVEVTREPLGVIGVITPWNFPLAIVAWKLAPALACGNTVVLKPAELVPASPWAIADIVNRAGLPPGVLNLVLGPGAKLGPALASSSDIDAVTFATPSGCCGGLPTFRWALPCPSVSRWR